MILSFIKKVVPGPVLDFLRPIYHWLFSVMYVIFYGRPSRKMVVVGVTGTNGKTSVVEFVAQILRSGGVKTASISSVYFRVGDEVRKNDLKMTMPGRFFLQKFLRRALKAGCTHAILEITSEGIKQFRHKNIDWDILVLTNITPEHIESHGSFENYRKAKEKVFAMLSKTYRKSNMPKTIIINGDDPSAQEFLKYEADKKIIYSKIDAPKNEKLTGEFNFYNLAAAAKIAEALGVSPEIILRASEKIEGVPGRMEFVQKEPFAVVVDYAHTPDALRKVYETLRPPAGKTLGVFGDLTPSVEEAGGRLICVLGSAGGGRDKWKRPEMGKIATEFCGEIILTNEDPYDEEPEAIIKDVLGGITGIRSQDSPGSNPRVLEILDRKEAIRKAVMDASAGDIVIITGKGAEPWLMGPNGQKTPWDDREIAREALYSYNENNEKVEKIVKS